MAQRTVPPEIATRIVCHAAADKQIICALARTSRTLQEAAEKMLYEHVDVYPHPLYFPLIRTLAACSRVANYIRHFTLGQANVQIPSDFWDVVRTIILRLRELDRFAFEDQTLENSWVLAPPRNSTNASNSWNLSALEARISVPWDENLAAFLISQRRLKSLEISVGALEDVPMVALPPGSLPQLTHFEGPLMVADQLLQCGCSLTHLKVNVDTEDDISLLPLVVPSLNRLPKLKSLAIANLPPEMACSTVSAICRNCPNLQYIGYIPLPMEHRQRLSVIKMLGRLPRLSYVEFDVRHWDPPVSGVFQRPFAVEVLMVARYLKSVMFWNIGDRSCWSWQPENVQSVNTSDQEGGNQASGNNMAINFVGVEGWKHQFHPTTYTFCTTTWRSIV